MEQILLLVDARNALTTCPIAIITLYVFIFLISSTLQTAKGAKMHNAAVAATIDGLPAKEGEEKVKMHTHSYCCLDYAQVAFIYLCICLYLFLA